MPSRAWPLWVLTGLVLTGLPITTVVGARAEFRAGVLPPHADSIGIPIFSSIILSFIAAPVVLGAAWLCLRRYNPASRWAAWRPDRPWRSLLSTLILGGLATLVAIAVVADLVHGTPWYEYPWTAYAALVVVWLLTLRAAIIEQR